MYLPKTEVYTALATIPNCTVLQAAQKTLVEAPAITFFVTDNSANLDLSNSIASQNVEVTVDIWGTNSSNADSLLSQAETKLRALGYRLAFCIDVPDSQNICHINTRFDAIKTT